MLTTASLLLISFTGMAYAATGSVSSVAATQTSQPSSGKICSDFPQRISDHYGPEKVICTIQQSACGEDVTGVCKRIAEAGIQDCVSSYIPGDQESATQVVHGCIQQYTEISQNDSLCNSMGSFETLSPFEKNTKEQACRNIVARAVQESNPIDVSEAKIRARPGTKFVTMFSVNRQKNKQFLLWPAPVIFPIFWILFFCIRFHLFSLRRFLKIALYECVLVGMSFIFEIGTGGFGYGHFITDSEFFTIVIVNVLLLTLFIVDVLWRMKSVKSIPGDTAVLSKTSSQDHAYSLVGYILLTVIMAPFVLVALITLTTVYIGSLGLFVGSVVFIAWLLCRIFPQRIEQFIQRTLKGNR